MQGSPLGRGRHEEDGDRNSSADSHLFFFSHYDDLLTIQIVYFISNHKAINLSRDINPNTPKFLKIPKIRKLFPYGKFIESRTIDEIPNPYDLCPPHDSP